MAGKQLALMDSGKRSSIIESGFYNYRYQPSDDGYFKNAKPKSKSDLIEYDFDEIIPCYLAARIRSVGASAASWSDRKHGWPENN